MTVLFCVYIIFAPSFLKLFYHTPTYESIGTTKRIDQWRDFPGVQRTVGSRSKVYQKVAARYDMLIELLNKIDSTGEKLANPYNAEPVEGPQLQGARNMTVYDFDQIYRHYRHNTCGIGASSKGVRGFFLAWNAAKWYTSHEYCSYIFFRNSDAVKSLVEFHVSIGEPRCDDGKPQPDAQFHYDSKTGTVTLF